MPPPARARATTQAAQERYKISHEQMMGQAPRLEWSITCSRYGLIIIIGLMRYNACVSYFISPHMPWGKDSGPCKC